jgi:maltose/moltooligosaccharide transporter
MEPSPTPKISLWNSSHFKVGSLSYTRSALLTVMFWMLWADLCLQLMEQLPNIIPLQMKWLGASDALIGFIKDSLQAALTVCFVPVIGMQSDRHRGPMGRRRPFLLWCTFPVCAFLILLGFVEPLSRGLHAVLAPVLRGIALPAVGITLIGIFAAGFFFFNNYIIQVYQYLVADVVPKETMGSFIGFYRAIGAVGAFVFNRWIFGYAETHVAAVYIGCALLYSTAFFLLVWQVKEGEYPPSDESAKRIGPVEFVRRYAKECFSHSFYLKVFCIALFYWAAWVPFMTFVVFFATKNAPDYAPSLGVSVDAFGKIKAWTFLPTVLVFACCGPLIDRFHALRILLVGIVGATATFFAGFFIVHTPNQFLVWWIINQIALAVFGLAYLAMFPALFPRQKYGQYFSANQLFFSVGLVLAPFLCGKLMDLIKDYRYLFVWSGVCAALSMVFAFAVYKHWKRLGGDTGYVAPVYSNAEILLPNKHE